MPLSDLTKDEHAALVQLLRHMIVSDRSVMSPRLRCLKGIHAKLDPASVEPAAAPYRAPKPSADPREESEIAGVIVAAIEKHARGGVEALARGIIENLRGAGLENRRTDAIPQYAIRGANRARMRLAHGSVQNARIRLQTTAQKWPK